MELQNWNETNGTSGRNRRVLSNRLIVAILLCPFLFLWFAFRPGYAWRARLLAVALFFPGVLIFSLILSVVAGLLGGFEEPRKDVVAANAPRAQPASPHPTPKSRPAGPAFVRDLPLQPLATSSDHAPHFSPAALKMKHLYEELQGFRYDPMLHILGVDGWFTAMEWRGKVRLLGARSGATLLKELGLEPGSLITLAEIYAKTKGNRTDRSAYWEAKFAGTFYPQKRQSGEGRLLRDSLACKDFGIWARSMRAMDLGQYEESSALQDQAGCEDVAKGVVVSAPTVRKAFLFKDGSSATYVRITLRHNAVWVNEDEVAY